MIKPDYSWVVEAIRQLNRAGSWTGRLHIQKALFVSEVATAAKPPFEFQMYNYGPYSFELDSAIGELELLGYVARSYRAPGYGPSYCLTALGEELANDLNSDHQRAIAAVAGQFRDAPSRDLELRATCLWVMERDGLDEENEIARRVVEIKPKYKIEDAHEALRAARQLRRALSDAR